MKFVLAALFALVITAPLAHAAEPDPHLAALAPFVGKTWRGEFADSTPENPIFDVQSWEWALNGRAIRILHSVNDGEYGGETMVVYDRARERIVYFYFTTADFYTTGTIACEDGLYVAHEEVTGSADGTTAVRSTGVLGSDGTLQVQAEYLKNGGWIPGHSIRYVEAPEAKVVFR